MHTKGLLAILIALAAGFANPSLQPAAAGDQNASNAPVQAVGSPASVPLLRVTVDPRVELLSLIFRLAGNPEYSRGKVDSYSDDAENQFGTFREHPVVNLARKLRTTRGVSYDACMSMAVHLTDAYELQLKIPLAPWPESLDKRWTPESAGDFLAAARQFVRDTGFREFIEKHRPLYQTTQTRMDALMKEKGHLEWFEAFFGARPEASFTVVPGMLNGGCCYGPHFRDAAGREELFCILGVWQTDTAGLPEFTSDMLDTVVHEFGHSYANPLIERHLDQLRQPGETLFAQVAGRMRSQAYGNASTMLRESLVRACVIRYVRQYGGNEAAQSSVQKEKKRGFLWMQELSDLLGDYEAHRDQYPALEAFSPRLISFFRDYARDFAKKQAALEAKRPKVVPIPSASGAMDVAFLQITDADLARGVKIRHKLAQAQSR